MNGRAGASAWARLVKAAGTYALPAGRSVRSRPSAGAKLGRLLYTVSFQLMYRLTRIYLPFDAEVGERV